MIRRATAALAAGLIACCLSPAGARAQIIASERGTVTQTVDGTVMTVDYSRPSLRGRAFIFETEVPRNLLWTPGADSATTFTFSKDVTIGGTPVPSGSYSVWMVTHRGDWQVILDRNTKMFHVPHPEPTLEQIAFSVTPDTTAPVMETLSFHFPEVRSDGAVLRFQWERTVVDLDIRVHPSRDMTTTAEQAAPYVGRWAVEMIEGAFGAPGWKYEMDLTHTGEYLAGWLEWEDPPREEIYLAPAADQVFNLVWVINGSVAGVVDVIFVEFTLDEDGRAVSFETRFGPEDVLIQRGERID